MDSVQGRYENMWRSDGWGSFLSTRLDVGGGLPLLPNRPTLDSEVEGGLLPGSEGFNSWCDYKCKHGSTSVKWFDINNSESKNAFLLENHIVVILIDESDFCHFMLTFAR
jgi:hypothetical protein